MQKVILRVLEVYMSTQLILWAVPTQPTLLTQSNPKPTYHASHLWLHDHQIIQVIRNLTYHLIFAFFFSQFLVNKTNHPKIFHTIIIYANL